MKPRLILLYIAISVLPAVAILVLTLRLGESEKKIQEERYKTEITKRLGDIANNCSRILIKAEEGLLPLVTSISVSPLSIPDVITSSSLLNNIFILDQSFKIIVPDEQDNLSGRDADFLKSLKTFLKSEENFYEKVQSAQNGWYKWPANKTAILFGKCPNGKIIAFDLHQNIIEENLRKNLSLVTELKDEQIKMFFKDKEIFKSGNIESGKDLDGSVVLNLATPLDDYSLELISDLPAFNSGLKGLGLIIGGILFSLTLGVICIYFYRENTRQERLALQRVNFANQVSHELKTPLTSIRMYAEILEDKLEDEDPKILKNLKVIVFESQRLSRMINNVLTFASDGKNKLTLRTSSIAVNELVEKVVNNMAPSLNKKNIRCEFKAAASSKINADSDAVEQILGNLLSNVEKYVPKGSEVKITSEQDDEWTKITVTDNGPGIPSSHTNKIFDSFHRVSNKLSDGVSGTGIGLTISKKYARLHGGDLLLLPTKIGASFCLKLPNKGPQNESTGS